MIHIEKDTLIVDILRRDEDAFSELFQSYAKLLWTVAGGILSYCAGGEQDIEECVSDVFIELWRHPEKYDPSRGSLKSYLCTITKSRAIDAWRRKAKENVVSLEEYMENTTADDSFEITDYCELYEAVRRLEEPTREIIVRRYFHDEKPAKIAKRLGLQKKEVENRLYRGKKMLSESLPDYRKAELT